jgi:lysophospholipase L1-like esterase
MESPPQRGRRIELALAAVVGAIPLYYAVTERTREVFVVSWSKRWTVLVLACAGLYVLLLASYRREWPRWLVRARSIALASATTLALLALAGEMSLRALDRPAFAAKDNRGRHAPDPDVGHVFVANHRQTIQTREYSVEWRSNAQGVRADRDFGPKPEGVARVLCVGDSFTEGAQVASGDTWPGRLQRCLDGALGAGRAEVVNAGFPGFSTVNEARWLAKFGAAFEPDLVIVAMTPNDLLENQFPLQYTARDGALVASTSTEADRAVFERHRKWWCLAGRVEESALRERVMGSPAVKRLLGRRLVNHAEAFMVERNDKANRLFALAERHLLEARDEAARQGAAFAVVVIPFREQLRPLGPNLDAARFGEHWTLFGAAHAFPVVDCLPAFAAHADPRSLHWREDAHCTAEGYATVARETCREILARPEAFGLPPPAK